VKFGLTLFCCTHLFFSIKSVFGQDEKKIVNGFETAVFSGYHFASNNIEKTGQSLNGVPMGFDISYLKYGINKSEFTTVYGRPKLGLTFRAIKMNNTDTFGYCFGILPVYTLPIILQKKLQVGLKISYGLNFNTKLYNEQNNFDNRAISFPVNFAFDIGTTAQLKVSNKLYVNGGLGLYHVSNGSLKMPNGGINIIYGNAGISYYPEGLNETMLKKPNYKLEKRGLHYMGYAAFAYRQLGYFDYITQFPIIVISNQVYYSVNKLYHTGIGLDGFYDATQPLLYNDQLRVSDIAEKQKYYLALGWYNKFEIGKLFLPFGVYHYVAQMKYVQEPVYLRFGLGYQFHPKFFTGIFFKGTINKKQQLQSDFMEWSFGIKL
jgi:hypothetical protein